MDFKHRKSEQNMNEIEKLTQMPEEVQNQQLRFFARANLEMRVKILSNQKQIFHKIKGFKGDVDNSILTLVSLLIAIRQEANSLDQIDLNLIKLRGKNNKRRLKRDILLGYWAIVKKLKNDENMSFREISLYLRKYHQQEISHSTIFAVWVEIEENKKDKHNG
jgi:hypothetical protein